MMRIFNYLLAVCCCAEVCGSTSIDTPAIVSIDHQDDFVITDLSDNSEYGRFRVSVFSPPKKTSNGSILFALKLHGFNLAETIRFEEEAIKNSDNGKVFYVEVPKHELSNETFYKEIQIKSDNENYKIETIKLRIEPKVEIFADQKLINFGKISHNGIHLTAENSPTIAIKYSVLKDAVCEVTSQNNFQLKHKDNYIAYSVNGITKNEEIQLPSNQDEYIANFRIISIGKSPTAGIYSDKITFSIKTNM